MKIKRANCSMLIDREGTFTFGNRFQMEKSFFAFLGKDGGKVELVRKMIQHEILGRYFPSNTSTV